MSYPIWTTDDVVLLIEWASIESISSIKEHRIRDALAIHQGVAAIVDLGQILLPVDSRANKWLNLRLVELSGLLRASRNRVGVVDETSILNLEFNDALL